MKDYQSIIKAMQEGNRNAVQEYLLSKGLSITQCPDGLWYILEIRPKNDEEMCCYMDILEIDEYNEYFEFALLQCDTNFENCSLMIDYEIWDLSFEEFIKIINRLWNKQCNTLYSVGRNAHIGQSPMHAIRIKYVTFRRSFLYEWRN